MKTISIDPIDSFIVISDVHLQNNQDSLTQLFLKTLEDLPVVDAVFFIGDIFDFIMVSKHFFLTYWKNVFDAFAALKSKGIKVYFIEGNHDFGFEYFPHPDLNRCFNAYGDFDILCPLKNTHNLLFSHGDLMVCPPIYVYFRKLVKSWIFQRTASFLIPGFFAHRIFCKYAKISRKKDIYRILSLDFLQSQLEKHLSQRKVTHLLMGHVHVDLDKEIAGARCLIGPSWMDKPNYLIYQEGIYQRIYLTDLTKACISIDSSQRS